MFLAPVLFLFLGAIEINVEQFGTQVALKLSELFTFEKFYNHAVISDIKLDEVLEIAYDDLFLALLNQPMLSIRIDPKHSGAVGHVFKALLLYGTDPDPIYVYACGSLVYFEDTRSVVVRVLYDYSIFYRSSTIGLVSWNSPTLFMPFEVRRRYLSYPEEQDQQ